MSMESALLWATAVGGTVTAIATVGLVIVAAKTLGGAQKQLRLLREQVIREGRPYVIAEVVPGIHGAGFTDLVIANSGRTIAHDVAVDVGPLARRDAEDHISDALRKYLDTPRTLAPGARHRLMWRMEPHNGMSEAGANRADVTGKIAYRDDEGRKYTESYDLSVDTMLDAMPVPTEGAKVSGSSRTKTEMELGNISRAIRALNLHVGELRR